MALDEAAPFHKRRAVVPRTAPRIGIALGGGGARGLAHIAMLEVLDDLGLKPAVIAGTSIGAIIGAAYASGIRAAELRHFTLDILSRRLNLLREVYSARIPRGWGLGAFFQRRSAFVDAEALLRAVLPPQVKERFEDLEIPLSVIASDFYGLEPVVLSKGALLPAVAASMALPVLFEPVVLGGRTLVDGGLTNPLPYDILHGAADIIIAVNVAGVTVAVEEQARPTALESIFSASLLFERSIVREKLKVSQPDIFIDAGTGRFHVLDFLKAREIFAECEPSKALLRTKLERILSTDVISEV